MKQTIQRRIADRLLAEGALSPEAHATALSYCALHGGRMEDAIIDMQMMAEADLLKAISTVYGTRFVSTQKLYSAQIDPRILSLVPKKLAEMHCLFPVIWEGDKMVLTVATADPDNVVAFQEVKLAASVRDVKPIVARPAAVRAAIARSYFNDPQQFATLINPLATGDVTGAGIKIPVMAGFQLADTAPSKQTQQPAMQARPQPAAIPLSVAPMMPAHENVLAQPAAPAKRPPPAPPRGVLRNSEPEIIALEDDVDEVKTRAREAAPAAPPKQAPPPPPAAKPTHSKDYLETVNVLVSLLENGRPDLRGHSAGVARVAQKICDRIGLPPDQTKSVRLASYIHDLGKAGTYHLTALNVAEYDGHRTAAQKVVSIPESVLSSVELPADAKSAVGAMYERIDGKGFPLGASGKDIPIGARILAVADSYADLTQNPRNPARRILAPAEACATLAVHRGTIFDPTVIDLLTHIVTGDDIRAKLLSDRQTVLIVDPDPEESTVLELRLIDQGFDVRIARSMQQAVHELTTRDVACVVSEVDLDVPDDGIALRGRAISESWGNSVTWIILTKKSDRQLAQIVFDLGVDDFISKSTGADVVVAKVKQIIEKKKAKPSAASPRGVSGSLAEMALPDMVQILFHGRKTCALRIQGKKGAGEIHFAEGQIVDARIGSVRGEDAFYQMLMLREGDFQLDPNAQASQRTIQSSPEALLLEGMRRVDEGLVG